MFCYVSIRGEEINENRGGLIHWSDLICDITLTPIKSLILLNLNYIADRKYSETIASTIVGCTFCPVHSKCFPSSIKSICVVLFHSICMFAFIVSTLTFMFSVKPFLIFKKNYKSPLQIIFFLNCAGKG